MEPKPKWQKREQTTDSGTKCVRRAWLGTTIAIALLGAGNGSPWIDLHQRIKEVSALMRKERMNIGRKHISKGAAAALAALLIVTIGGAGAMAYATAAGIPGPDGTIHGCYVTAAPIKPLVLIDPTAGGHCPAGYTPITFNQQGQPGPQGVPGQSDAYSASQTGGLTPLGGNDVVVVSLSLPPGSFTVTATGDVRNLDGTTAIPVGCDLQRYDTHGGAIGIGFVFINPQPGGWAAAALQAAFNFEEPSTIKVSCDGTGVSAEHFSVIATKVGVVHSQ